jgi:hypothetical protein
MGEYVFSKRSPHALRIWSDSGGKEFDRTFCYLFNGCCSIKSIDTPDYVKTFDFMGFFVSSGISGYALWHLFYVTVTNLVIPLTE